MENGIFFQQVIKELKLTFFRRGMNFYVECCTWNDDRFSTRDIPQIIVAISEDGSFAAITESGSLIIATSPIVNGVLIYGQTSLWAKWASIMSRGAVVKATYRITDSGDEEAGIQLLSVNFDSMLPIIDTYLLNIAMRNNVIQYPVQYVMYPTYNPYVSYGYGGHYGTYNPLAMWGSFVNGQYVPF